MAGQFKMNEKKLTGGPSKLEALVRHSVDVKVVGAAVVQELNRLVQNNDDGWLSLADERWHGALEQHKK